MTLHVGHVLDVLAGLEVGSVQTCITSPPYWGLRAYSTEPQVWGGGDCEHAWAESVREQHQPNTSASSTLNPCPAKDNRIARGNGPIVQATCTRCGAWRGELGSEPTPEQFVANIVAVFRAVRRVLRDDGTLWLNLGDSYAADHAQRRTRTENYGIQQGIPGSRNRDGLGTSPGLKPKDLVGIPWRVAFALQADGWYLRSDIIWSKPNPMPESVTDRPTKAHEYLFLLSKRADYYYDAEAIKESSVSGHSSGNGFRRPSRLSYLTNGESRESDAEWVEQPSRNARSVWTIPTEAYPAAHFATFPRKLVEPCVLAGSRPEDVVLDPFAGSGTTLAVARWHQRRAVGIELNPEYARLVTERLRQGVLL